MELAFRNTTDSKYPIQKPPVIDLNEKIPQLQPTEDFTHDLHTFCIRDHRVKMTSNVKITLAELPVAALDYGWTLPPPHLSNMVAFHLLHFIHGQITSKRDSKVIAQRQQLSTLILQIVDEPRVLAIPLSKHFL